MADDVKEVASNNTKYNYSGGTVRISSGKSVEDFLLPDFYKLCLCPLTGFYLEIVPPFKVPSKVYGQVEGRIDTILNTYDAVKDKNLGVLLDGIKGCGKTLLMNSLCDKMVNYNNVPVISISDRFGGGNFVSFINSIDQDCVIAFDEFEKIYCTSDKDHLPSILELLDGQSRSHKMFLFTCNDSYRMTQYLQNRPSRIRYRYRYGYLDAEIVNEIVGDMIIEKKRLNEVSTFINSIGNVTFDIVIAMISEINLYPKDSLSDIFSRMNVEMSNERENFTIVGFNKGEKIKSEDIDFPDFSLQDSNKDLYYGRVRGLSEFDMNHCVIDPNDEENVLLDEEMIFTWMDADLNRSDYSKHKYVFKKGHYSMIIQKNENTAFTFADAYFKL